MSWPLSANHRRALERLWAAGHWVPDVWLHPDGIKTGALRALRRLGLAEGKRRVQWGRLRWVWRITDAGKSAAMRATGGR